MRHLRRERAKEIRPCGPDFFLYADRAYGATRLMSRGNIGAQKKERLTESVVFDDKTDDNIKDQATDDNNENTGTPTIERRDVFLRWQSNDRFFILVDGVGVVFYGITDVRVPPVNKHRVMHHCNRHAVVQINTIMVVDVANDDAVIVRSGDGWRNCFTGRTEGQET